MPDATVKRNEPPGTGLGIWHHMEIRKLAGLVVEDEWLLRLELAEELGTAGWQVREAGSGEEAVQLLEQMKSQDEALEFLVTDIRLGGPVDGWDVADTARKLWPNLPVIYVSANPIEDKRRASNSVFLGKPVEVENLIAACKRLTDSA